MPQEVLLPNAAAPAQHAPHSPKVWVLIGPSAKGCAQWGPAPLALLAELRRVQPAARLFTMDLPGAGVHRTAGSPSKVEALAPVLRQRLQDSGHWSPGQGLGLIGHSLGGLVAIEWARRAPQEVSALVLLSPAMRPFTRLVRATPLVLWAKAAAHALGRDVAPAGGRAPLAAAVSHGLARWRYAASRRRPIAQVLLLAGERDTWRDWRVAQRISRAWGAALRLHPRAGHDLLTDDAPWVARSVAEWLLPVGSAPLP